MVTVPQIWSICKGFVSWQKLILLVCNALSLQLPAADPLLDGRVRRAQTQISLGIRITQSLGYLKSADLAEEHRRCVWTLFMLDRTFSISRTITPALHYNQFQLPLPTSDESFLRLPQSKDSRLSNQPENDSADADIGIGAIIVKVFSIWNDVLQYVFRSPPKSNAPPWQADSDLADIESQFTDFEPGRKEESKPPDLTLTPFL